MMGVEAAKQQTTSLPPWQLRWKRPQFDNAILGISSDGDSSSNDTEYEDIPNEIKPNWKPISSSSVVLTRREAKTAIVELNKRDKLLIRRRRSKQNNNAHHDHVSSSSPTRSSPLDELQENITPRKENTKPSAILRTTTPAPFDDEDVKSSSAKEVDDDTTIVSLTDFKALTKSNKSPTNTWFKSITSAGNKKQYGGGGKPPRSSSSEQLLRKSNVISPTPTDTPTSPTGRIGFSTFNVKTPPPPSCLSPPFSADDGGSNMYDSPPETSAASSLLWEDMTLTSVSEEDALHYRHGSQHQQQQQQYHQKLPRFSGTTTQYEMDANDDENDGKCRLVRPISIHQRSDDWDGYDNVVLSTTIYSTIAATRYQESGEVIVMELLSTKNLPIAEQVTKHANNNNAAQQQQSTKANEQQQQQQQDSSSSSHTQSQSPKTTSSGGSQGDNSSTNSAHLKPTYSTEDGDEGMSNHTQILARRVMYWPSYIVDQNNDNISEDKGRLKKNVDYPALVSLGRTSIWKEHSKNDDEEDNKVESAKVVVDKEDIEEEVDYQHEKSCGNNNSILGNICGPLFDNEDAEESSGDNEQYHREKGKSQGKQQFDSSTGLLDEERLADAMEAYQSLNFLFGGSNENLAFQSKSNPSKKEKKVDVTPKVYDNDYTKKKLTQPLSMCLITQNGTVHFYHALRVLLSGGKSNKRQVGIGFSNDFASLFVGSDIFRKINDSVLPLSHPRASVQLSQLVQSKKKGEDMQEETNGNQYGEPPSWKTFLVQQEQQETVGTANDDTKLGDDASAYRNDEWSSLGTFDASIDPTSLPLRTIRKSNIITGSCITSDTSNSYLAICGKGLRRIVHKKNKDDVNTGNIRRRRHISHVLGGYVTFISLHHCSESRTVYLPFAPEDIYPVHWMGMHFVVILGESGLPEMPNQGQEHYCHQPCAMAVRVDCNQEETGVQTNITSRFGCIPINLPSAHESLGLPLLSRLLASSQQSDYVKSKAIAISSLPSSPPGILLSYQIDSSALVVINHRLLPFQVDQESSSGSSSTKCISFPTIVQPGHRAVLDMSSTAAEGIVTSCRNIWCIGGQGWSLVGIQGQGTSQNYFICWDGATDDIQGPSILPFQNNSLNEQAIPSAVTPLMSHMKYEGVSEGDHCHKVVTNQSYSTMPCSNFLSFLDQNEETEGEFSSTSFTPKGRFSASLVESIRMAAIIEGGIDNIIVNALDSISTPNKSQDASTKSTIRGNRIKSITAMSHKEKSKRLLRQCSSWTQLDDTKANRRIVHGQVVVTTIRVGLECWSLTLRTNVVTNPITTPFDQVLSWLCQRRDYYTAASVALSLLDDAEAVYQLCGISKSSKEEFTHHKGLLDGIKPLVDDSTHGDIAEALTSLADMTVGCLIKGGVTMSSTLEGFLSRNKHYNSPRACLMLVGAMASAVSRESNNTQIRQPNKNDNIMNMLSAVENPSEDILWPVRCLMRMSVVRNCVPSAILMLNATIPNELRWRAPKTRGLASSPRPSLGLFLALVEIMLESSEEATRYFLNMREETGSPYWVSIDNSTRLVLSLLSIRGKHIMLQEPEVRAWVLERLKEEIESPADSPYSSHMNDCLLPDECLKEVIIGSFFNAECDMLGLDTILSPTSDTEITCYPQDMLQIRDVFAPQEYSGSLDYDILIAALLILANRGCDSWRDGTNLSVQVLLNTICDMAGKKTDVEPKFVFDSARVMFQCALVENLQAAAFLVGGKKGLVIECADLLVSTLGISINAAESALHAGSLVKLKGTVGKMYEGIPMEKEKAFTPSAEHQHLLWIIQERLLNIHTYGEFESDAGGKITPVFAGRVCFRAWHCLTHPLMLDSSAKWLEEWLRRELHLKHGQPSKRLACAALVRTLLWADESEDLDLSNASEDEEQTILGTVIGLDVRFLAELAQSCCGLIQSIPFHLAEEVMSSFSSRFFAIVGGMEL